MINNIGNISIGGIGSLKIFGIDFQGPTLNSPASLDATFIQENNNFPNVGISLTSRSTIRIGSMSLSMYPVSSSITHSSKSGGLMKVRYIDNSFILDQYIVGLNTKHHEPGTSNSSRVILVGEQIDPCKNEDLEFIDDLCDPCVTKGDEDLSEVDCNYLRFSKILEVDYTFEDLIQALKSKGISINNSRTNNYNGKYRASYIGSIRSVLQSWCSDLGLSYVFSNGIIFLFDLSRGIQMRYGNLKNNNKTISYTENSTLENTTAKGSIIYYGLEGETKDYSCSTNYEAKLACRSLTLSDLAGKATWGTGNGPTNFYGGNQTAAFSLIEACSLLTSYSPVLRDAVLWFDAYNIRSAELARNNGGNSAVASFSPYRGPFADKDDFLRNRYALPLMQMTIKASVGESEDSEKYNSIVESLDDGAKKLIEDAKNNNKIPYFFIASYNEAVHQKLMGWEDKIGNEFLGKYFIRKFDSPMTVSPDISAGDSDTVNFFKSGSKNVPFSPLFPYQNGESYISELVNLGLNNEARDSFILVTRNSAPVPSTEDQTIINNLINLADQYLPIRLGEVNKLFPGDSCPLTNGNKVSGKWDSVDNKGDFLYIGFELPNGLNTTSLTTGTHPTAKHTKFYYDPKTTPINLGSATLEATNFSVGGVTFWFPPQACVRDVKGGYYVYYRSPASIDSTINLPKSEYVLQNIPNSSNVMSLDINFKDFNNKNVREYSRTNLNSTCKMNKVDIKNSMKEYALSLSSLHNTAHNSVEFEIDGLPISDYSVEDGLASFSVRVSSDEVRTNLVFSDFKDMNVQKSLDFLEFQLRGKGAPYSTLSNLYAPKQQDRLPEI